MTIRFTHLLNRALLTGTIVCGRRIVADLSLDKAMLQDVLSKKL